MMQNPAGAGGFAKPKVRNAMIGLAPLVCMILGNGLASVTSLASLLSLVGVVVYFALVVPMVGELNAITGGSLAWWPVFIPIYNIIWAVSMVPGEVRKAKERAGSKT